MNGDILSLIDFGKLYQFAKDKGLPLTISIKKEITPFEFGNIFFDGDVVTEIQEKPDLVNYILAGIYVMSPAIFDHIPADTYYGMDKLIKDLMAKNIPVIKYEMDEYWLDIGRVKDYERAQADYDEKFK